MAKQALEGLDGVIKAQVSYKKGRGEVLYDAKLVSPKEMVQAIEKAGFKAEQTTLEKIKAADLIKKKDCGFLDAFC